MEGRLGTGVQGTLVGLRGVLHVIPGLLMLALLAI